VTRRVQFPVGDRGLTDATRAPASEEISAEKAKHLAPKIDEPSMPLVVAPREACRMLSIGLTRLYELLHHGHLESYRDGGSRRITVASIKAYVGRQLEVNPAPLGNRISRR
jgi:excisionase family DNA binding protein